MIEAKDVYFTYPTGVEALKGVSLTIKESEFIAIMGQNGAGKTTLIKHFNGLLKPTKGNVLVDCSNTRDLSVAKLARKVGFVFQNPDNQLFCETVEEEVAFALKNFGFEKSKLEGRVTWALNLLGLMEYRKTSPFMLSGGERKRVALASVLAWNPKYLVMDEPTIGQDYEQKEKLRQFIVQLNAQGKAVVVVTHDVEFVAECTPRVILMANGKIVVDDEGRRVLTNGERLSEASVLPPQVTQIFMELKDFGLETDVIDLYEARRLIRKRLSEK